MSNRSTITLNRIISAEAVEAILQREDVRTFKKVVRGLRASRGTPDWIHDVLDLQDAALNPIHGPFFRELAVRHLTRLNTGPGELAKPNWARIIAENGDHA